MLCVKIFSVVSRLIVSAVSTFSLWALCVAYTALVLKEDVRTGCCCWYTHQTLSCVCMILIFITWCKSDTTSGIMPFRSASVLCNFARTEHCIVCAFGLRLQIAFEDQETEREGFLSRRWIAITFTAHSKETRLLPNSLSLSRGVQSLETYVRANMCTDCSVMAELRS